MKKFAFQISILIFFTCTSTFAQKVFYKDKYYTLKNDKIFQRGKIVTKGLNNAQRDSIYTIARELYDERGKLKPKYKRRKVKERFKAPENFWEDRAEKLAQTTNNATVQSAVAGSKKATTTNVDNKVIAKAEEKLAEKPQEEKSKEVVQLETEEDKTKEQEVMAKQEAVAQKKIAKEKQEEVENSVKKLHAEEEKQRRVEEQKAKKESKRKEQKVKKEKQIETKKSIKKNNTEKDTERESQQKKERIKEEKTKKESKHKEKKNKRELKNREDKSIHKKAEKQQRAKTKKQTPKKSGSKQQNSKEKKKNSINKEKYKEEGKREKQIRKTEKEQRKQAKENKKTAKQLKKKEKALKNLENATATLTAANAISEKKDNFETIYFKINKEKTVANEYGDIKLYFDLINNSNKTLTILNKFNALDNRLDFFSTTMECEDIPITEVDHEPKYIKVKEDDYITVLPNSKYEFFIHGMYDDYLSCMSDDVVIKIMYNPFKSAEEGFQYAEPLQKDFKKVFDKITKIKIESENIKFKLRKQ